MNLPRPLQAVLEALQFPQGNPAKLRALNESDWAAALRFCDPAHLTLTLGALCRDAMPPTIEARVAQNARNNAHKFTRLKSEFHQIAEALSQHGLDFAVLKGFTHSPDFTPDPLWRAQGDIDLWLQPPAVHAAYDALRALGYVPFSETEGRHLPPLVRPVEWTWHGDFFDPAMPIPVDLHYRLWDDSLEHIPAPGLEAFWDRREAHLVDDLRIQVLHPADALAFAALHHLLHVLRGDARLQRAWEIGAFLERRRAGDAFWNEWRDLHPAPLRRLETIAFCLSAEWFGCRLPPCVQHELDRLPAPVKKWFARHAWAPVENLFQPNKHELGLHLSLVESSAGRAAVFRRRVFPLKTLAAGEEWSGAAAAKPWRRCLNGLTRRFSRIAHHARTLPSALLHGYRWWRSR